MKTVTVQSGRACKANRRSRAGILPALLNRAFLHRNTYLILVSAFLLGSSNISSSLLPMGATFFAALEGTAGIKILTAAAVLAGVTLNGPPEQVYVNVAGMLLFSVLSAPLKNTGSRISIRAATILFVSLLGSMLMLAGLGGFLLYDILKAVFSSFISFVLYCIFRFAVPVMSGKMKKALLDGEEAVSVAITAVLVLSGMGIFQIAGFSLRNIFCVLLLMLFSYKCGAGIGAASGTLIGLLISASSEFTPSVAGTYALCGMLAGILGNLGRFGTAFGFILGNMLLALYFNGTIESMLLLKEIAVASIVFLILPKRIINMLTGPFIREAATVDDKRGYSRRIRDITVEKLQKFSKAFQDLSKTFEEIAETKAPSENQDINILFDRVADRICSSCSLCMHCWGRNFYDTYQVMFNIVEKLETKGRVEENDIPGYFIEKCPRINDFVNAVNNMYELFKVDVVWKSRLCDSRLLISRQFEGLSKVIMGLAGEINSEISFLAPLEDAIVAALIKENIRAREVIAYKNNWGKYEVSILHNACGGVRICVDVIEKIVSDVVGRRMVRETEGCGRNMDGDCFLKLLEAEDLQLTTAVARAPKFGSNVSGDSFSFMNNEYGKYMIALSDGMGSGHNAALQSKATLNMLESFLESGFDKDMAINLINSVLVLRSDGDNTCTIDISIVDLFSGDVEFVKIGAAPTYIKSGTGVDIIRSATLPAGILPGIDTELAHRKVENGDMIIMVTDGIIDSLADDESGERELMAFIRQLDSLNPQQVADLILSRAKSGCDNKPFDDMTVLVAKVWKKPR